MRKSLFLWTLLLSVACAVGCSKSPDSTDNTKTPPPTPTPDAKPEIALTAGEVTSSSFTFSITTTVAGELGFGVAAEGYANPTIDELFARNSAEVTDNATLTVENLTDDTNYTLFAVLRAKDSGVLSEPKKLTFTTAKDNSNNPIRIENVGYDNATFTISIPGNILFQCIDKSYLDYQNMTIEDYFRTEGIAIREEGPVTVEWVNGNMYGPTEMRMREDSEYYVIAAASDGAAPYPNIIGEIYYKQFRTLRKPTTSAGVTTELKDITSTSVTINTVPDETVAEYYVYVHQKSWSDMVVENFGEATLISTIKKAGTAWRLTGSNEAVWTTHTYYPSGEIANNLLADTDYTCHIVVIDSKGAEALTRMEFKTSSKTLEAPVVELSITEPTENPHCNLNLNIYSEGAAYAKIVFRPTADIAYRRNEGFTDEQLVENYGFKLSEENVKAIATTGLSFKVEELWPEVEYTAIVSIKNAEQTETLKTSTHTTPKQAAAPRVESELFTSLLGEWELTYTLIQENQVEATVTEVVTIAQGVDEKTNADYREQNRLVILGFPFEVSAQGEYMEMPVFLPSDLYEELEDYYKKGYNLIYRDYGPKIFLEIGQGDTITVPTSKGCYLYNWSSDGFLSFYGADYDNRMSAPAPFPVTLRDNGDTLVIGAYQSGEEFGYGIYRPAVFLNDQKMESCATTDIILKRVK